MRKYSKYHVDTTREGKKQREDIDYKTGEKIKFDSLLEKRFYNDVIVPQMKSGQLKDYKLQKTYVLQKGFKQKNRSFRPITYVADFWMLDKKGHEKIVDTKGGMVDPSAKIKEKMMHYIYPKLDYVWMTWTKATGWIDYQDFLLIKKEKKKLKNKAKS
jgi:hypothetical protein